MENVLNKFMEALKKKFISDAKERISFWNKDIEKNKLEIEQLKCENEEKLVELVITKKIYEVLSKIKFKDINIKSEFEVLFDRQMKAILFKYYNGIDCIEYTLEENNDSITHLKCKISDNDKALKTDNELITYYEKTDFTKLFDEQRKFFLEELEKNNIK